MNNVRAVADVILAIGIIVLILGIVVGANELLTYQKTLGNILGHSYDNEVFWRAAQNYIIGGILGIVVGCLLFRLPEHSNVKVVQVIPPSTSQGSAIPVPVTGTCPSCGRTAVFVSEYQRWYCPEEKKYI